MWDSGLIYLPPSMHPTPANILIDRAMIGIDLDFRLTMFRGFLVVRNAPGFKYPEWYSQMIDDRLTGTFFGGAALRLMPGQTAGWNNLN